MRLCLMERSGGVRLASLSVSVDGGGPLEHHASARQTMPSNRSLLFSTARSHPCVRHRQRGGCGGVAGPHVLMPPCAQGACPPVPPTLGGRWRGGRLCRQELATRQADPSVRMPAPHVRRRVTRGRHAVCRTGRAEPQAPLLGEGGRGGAAHTTERLATHVVLLAGGS
jgi:hypothetical protein